MNLLSSPRRRHRSHEWTGAKAVTFIVTLAATGNVTLAARAAGMSRKSAYALESRDPGFAAAWQSALDARRRRRQGDKVGEADTPPAPPGQGDSAIPAAGPNSATGPRPDRALHEAARDLFFARLAANRGFAPSPAEGLLRASLPLSSAP